MIVRTLGSPARRHSWRATLGALGAILVVSLLLCPAPLRAQRAPQSVPQTSAGGARAAPREDFSNFFHRFRSDSTFQRARIRFPLPWYTLADDDTQRVTAREWSFASFDYGHETYTQIFDNFALRTADTDERVYALIGFGSGIRQNWYFQRVQGRWFLVRVEDLSM